MFKIKLIPNKLDLVFFEGLWYSETKTKTNTNKFSSLALENVYNKDTCISSDWSVIITNWQIE